MIRHIASYFLAMTLVLTVLAQPDGSDLSHMLREAFHAAPSELRTPALADPRRAYDVTHYNLDLHVDPDTRTIAGALTMEAVATGDSLGEIELDLLGNMTVSAVWNDSAALAFYPIRDLLRIAPQRPLVNGERFSVTIEYSGAPRRLGFGSFTWSTHEGVPRIWTVSEPYGAPSWWPCKDDPVDKADSVFVAVTVPGILFAASNGVLVARQPDIGGNVRYRYETRYPISTYLVAVSIGDYETFSDWHVTAAGDSMPLTYHVFPELLEAARADFAVTRDMTAFFADRFGPYPFPGEQYGMISVPSGVAMEHQTLTTYPAEAITGTGEYDYINAHELAHQWFGNQVTIGRWPHIWLNEGFATYSEALWEEYVSGAIAYGDYMRSLDLGSFNGALFITDSTNYRTLFNITVYYKGAWVLHMLRQLLGDDAFFRSLRAYLEEPGLRYGNALTADFQRICERVSGQGLGWFFDQWVFRAGRPVYTLSWESAPAAGGYATRLTVRQRPSQPQENPFLYRMPVDIRLQGEGVDTVVTEWIETAEQEWRVETSAPVTSVTLDPDDKVLKRVVDLRSDPLAGIPDRLTLGQNYPNPFNGATTIPYAIVRPGDVTVSLFDALGRAVRTFTRRHTVPGPHVVEWDGLDARGMPAASGLYLYRIRDGETVRTRKLLLIR